MYHIKTHESNHFDIYNLDIKVNSTAQFNLAKKFSVEGIVDLFPLNTDGSEGYEIKFKDSLSWFPKKGSVKTKAVIFAGGVLGSMDLLLKMKEKLTNRNIVDVYKISL